MKPRVLLLNPAPSLIKYGVKWGFEQLGCFVCLFDGDNRIFDKSQEIQLQKIEKAMIEHKFDLLFCEGYYNMPVVEISALCKKYSIQFHWWAIEDPVTPQIGEYVSKYVDFIWTTTEEYLEKYTNLGIKNDLLLFGCNPDFQKPVPAEGRFKHDISAVGSNYSNRYDKVIEYLFPLLNQDIKVYGLYWMDLTRPVTLKNHRKKYWDEMPSLPYEWLPGVINSSKIMFGFNCSDVSKTQTSCRPYETLCSSGNSLYLTWFTPAQKNIFGDYIYQAKSRDEIIYMSKEILKMPDTQRIELANKARKFVAENHNYAIRCEKIISKL